MRRVVLKKEGVSFFADCESGLPFPPPVPGVFRGPPGVLLPPVNRPRLRKVELTSGEHVIEFSYVQREWTHRIHVPLLG
jgi:hypothetical protein